MSENNRNHQDYEAWVAALLTPLVASVALALCFLLLTLAEYLSPIERTIIMVVTISSALILCWWLFGFVTVAVLAAYQKASGKAVSIPRWMPKVLKKLAIGSIGLSIYAAPVVTSIAPATAVEQSSAQHLTDFVEHDSSLSSAQKNSISSFFTAPADSTADKDLTSFFYDTGLSIQEVDVKTYTNQTDPSINPFFTVTPREPLDAGDANSSGLHTVVAGDSLWTIAEHYLPTDSTDAQIMEFVNEIYQLNEFQLDSIDTLIRPGQQLLIPATQER
ncbi:LysM peptidoglycan-binding domain-containing protein [Rothia terrae]|uniref:LysM peptidoglycan-binding domain-containing protein n=1 Tax=Rothia terrae TaxID=396015 RepID=UPI0033CFBDA4